MRRWFRRLSVLGKNEVEKLAGSGPYRQGPTKSTKYSLAIAMQRLTLSAVNHSIVRAVVRSLPIVYIAFVIGIFFRLTCEPIGITAADDSFRQLLLVTRLSWLLDFNSGWEILLFPLIVCPVILTESIRQVRPNSQFWRSGVFLTGTFACLALLHSLQLGLADGVVLSSLVFGSWLLLMLAVVLVVVLPGLALNLMLQMLKKSIIWLCGHMSSKSIQEPVDEKMSSLFPYWSDTTHRSAIRRTIWRGFLRQPH
ncbi:MAG: hypothetical protein V1738_06420 [Patescibacteria group bacterium]